jgi:hypothetical protein
VLLPLRGVLYGFSRRFRFCRLRGGAYRFNARAHKDGAMQHMRGEWSSGGWACREACFAFGLQGCPSPGRGSLSLLLQRK